MMKSTKRQMFLSLMVFALLVLFAYAGEEEDSCEMEETPPTAEGLTWYGGGFELEGRSIRYPARKMPWSPFYDYEFPAISTRGIKDYDTQNDCCHWDGHLVREWEINNPAIGACMLAFMHGNSTYYSLDDGVVDVIPFSNADGYAPLTCTIWNYDEEDYEYIECPYYEGEGDTIATTIEFIDLCFDEDCTINPVMPANNIYVDVQPAEDWPVPFWEHNGQYYKYDWKWGWGWHKHVYTNNPVLLYSDVVNVDPTFCGSNFMIDVLGDRGDSEHSQIQMNKEFYLVGVEKIQILIGENWVDINKPNVFLNKDIGYSFRAVRHPSNVPWPDGNPVWTGAYNGTGEVASVTINQYGNFPLSVYCGASGKGVILWTYYVGVAPEENLEECMEGRPVTYYATIYPANVPVSSSDMCTFTFYFRTAMGVNWEGITYSTTRYGNYTAVACQVPDGSPGHMFTTPIHVDAAIGYAKAVSPTIFVDVYELWIDNPTSYKHVDYGTDFNSTSIHSNDCHGYLWSMPDGWPDAWALGGSINNDSGNLYVKEGESSLLGDSTTLKLECEDGEDRNHHDTKTVFVDGIYAVTAVKFDFDPASDQDGQNARINAADDITPPEWICPPTPNPNFPAVYVGNKTGMLQAKFAFTYGKSGKSFKVYANGNGEGALGGKGPLGDLNETLVDNDDYKTFTTKQSTPDVIKKQGMYFDWYFKSSTHADVETLQPKEINETGNHQIYIVAYPPEDPFNGSGSGDGVWTILLDVLCDDDWCEGMSIILNSDIVSKITQNTNESGFTYDTVHGAPSFVPGWYYFELTGCLSDWGSTTVNCSDCAYITSIYARALGIDPNLLRIKSYSGGYLLNWIKPIGCAWTNNPFNSNPRTGFSFHHVSTFPSDEKIYDACLDLDGDTSPTTQPNTVLKVLGLSYSSIYKQKLVAPEDISDIYEDNFPVLSLVNIY